MEQGKQAEVSKHWLYGIPAAAFAIGLLGSLRYQRGQTSKKFDFFTPNLPVHNYHLARRFAIQTLAIGTVASLTGVGCLALAISYATNARNFKEFSQFMESAIPALLPGLKEKLSKNQTDEEDEKELSQFLNLFNQDEEAESSC